MAALSVSGQKMFTHKPYLAVQIDKLQREVEGYADLKKMCHVPFLCDMLDQRRALTLIYLREAKAQLAICSLCEIPMTLTDWTITFTEGPPL